MEPPEISLMTMAHVPAKTRQNVPKHSADNLFIWPWFVTEQGSCLRQNPIARFFARGSFSPHSAAAGSGAALTLHKRYVAAATGKNPVVLAEVADELEVLPETCVMQHVPGVAAYRKNTPGLNIVMPVEITRMGRNELYQRAATHRS